MMNRVIFLLLFFIFYQVQSHGIVPASFEGWLRWQEKKLANLPKQKELNKQLVEFVTSPDFMEILSDTESLMKVANEAEVSKECKTAMEFAGMHLRSKWSKTMLDATAKLPPAVAQGATHWIGGFQQCMGDNRATNWTGSGAAPRSHYCKYTYGIPYVDPLVPGGSISIDVGLCLPETCSANDITDFINTVVEDWSGLLNKSIAIHNEAVCYVRRNEMSLSSGAIFMIVVCSIFGIFMAAGTLFDVLFYQNQQTIDKRMTINSQTPEHSHISSNGTSNVPYETMPDHDEEAQKPLPTVVTPARSLPLRWWEKVLLAFSVYTNAMKILDTSQQPDRLNCLDGIRFLSMSWVILGHTYFFIASTTNNLGIFYSVLTTWSYQAIMNATFSVDSFFVLSGLLTGYIFLKEATKMGTINKLKFWILYFFHRYWRLTPPYMLFLGFYTTLLKYMATGPMWNQKYGMDEKSCESNWWYNLLYINNFLGATKMCMGWSWYLANDMQFHYFVAPIVLPLMFFAIRPSRTMKQIVAMIVAVIAIIVGSVISLAVISVVNNIDVSLGAHGFDDIYIKPWCRVAAYVVGLFTAFAILEHKKGRFRLNKPVILLCWLFATAISLATLYGLYGVNHRDYTISEGVSALYNAMSRLTWAIGLSWLIFACICGYGGWINTFLSWKAFIPLSRLTYSAYLVHPVVMTIIYGSSLQAQMVTELSMVYFFFGHMIAAYLVAFVLSLTWESPLIGLERIVLRK